MPSNTISVYQQALTLAGLTQDQAVIYEFLLKNGKLTARKISQNTPYKRSLVYKYLEDLVKKGLVMRHDEIGKVSVFEPVHPLKLKDFAEKQEEQAKNAQQALDAVLGQMTSDFNLISGRPGVRFFEGKNGIIKIYEEMLAHGQNIESIEDKGEMAAFIPDYVKEFIKKRIKKGLRNRVIAPSDNPINVSSESELREVRSIATSKFPFKMDVKIAGRLVSFITFQKENPVGVLVDSQEIADNFRLLFETLWECLATTKPA